MKRTTVAIVISLLFIGVFFTGFYLSDFFDEQPQSLDKSAKPPIKKLPSHSSVDYTIGDKAILKLEKKHGDLLYDNQLNDNEGMDEDASTKLKNIISFNVKGNKITARKATNKEKFKKVIDDKGLQQELWHRFSSTIPLENRWMVTRFEIVTDGLDGTLGYVNQLDDPKKWTIALDYMDAANQNGLYATIIHEFGHLYSLNSYEFTNDSKKSCSTYMPDDLCLKQSSYLYAFYKDFWQEDTIQDWHQMRDIETDEEQQTNFFTTHPGEFVSEYATSHPTEDFAESWMYFVLTEKPQRYTVSDDKVLFFYQYPELIKLRNDILLNLVKEYK